MSWHEFGETYPAQASLSFLNLRSMSLDKFGEFAAVLFFCFLVLLFFWVLFQLCPYSLFFPKFQQMLHLLLLTHRSLKRCSFFSSLFSLCCSDWVITLFYIPVQWFFLLSSPFCCWVNLLSFLFKLYIFQFKIFHLLFLSMFYLSAETFCFFVAFCFFICFVFINSLLKHF